jgi:hypothetical protein
MKNKNFRILQEILHKRILKPGSGYDILLSSEQGTDVPQSGTDVRMILINIVDKRE